MSKRVQLTISEDGAKKLEEIAAYRLRTKSQMLEFWIRQELDKIQKEQNSTQ
ncbi:MAG: hypothetical protein QNJ37_04815 [Crocosphaera sp.]|nr:hypothetical protein [Crocosphaera sp.]